ncbi:hypothetical protein GOBAR_DD00892 [Gossypium barbadense]|nr:hypothetical protein GOBAR_DD00892 [Gossypium barbadense]
MLELSSTLSSHFRFLLQSLTEANADSVFRELCQVGYAPDYLFLLQTIFRTDPQRNLIGEATAFLLDVLKPNLPEHAFLQTKVLEINLVTFTNVADAILANGMFSHYDRPRIAQLCEKAGLYVRALQHYTELPDIKRVIVNTHAIEPQGEVRRKISAASARAHTRKSHQSSSFKLSPGEERKSRRQNYSISPTCFTIWEGLVSTFGASYVTRNKGRRASILVGAVSFFLGGASNAGIQHLLIALRDLDDPLTMVHLFAMLTLNL